ncbi:hypothetical protein ACK35S_03440 [Aeromonas veronii]
MQIRFAVNVGLHFILHQPTSFSPTYEMIGLATVTAPATGGLSYLAAAPVAAFTGLEVAAIITAASLGLGLILAIFKGYEEIGYDKGKLTLKKRQR